MADLGLIYGATLAASPGLFVAYALEARTRPMPSESRWQRLGVAVANWVALLCGMFAPLASAGGLWLGTFAWSGPKAGRVATLELGLARAALLLVAIQAAAGSSSPRRWT